MDKNHEFQAEEACHIYAGRRYDLETLFEHPTTMDHGCKEAHPPTPEDARSKPVSRSGGPAIGTGYRSPILRYLLLWEYGTVILEYPYLAPR